MGWTCREIRSGLTTLVMAVLLAGVLTPFMGCAPRPPETPGVVTVFCDTSLRAVVSEAIDVFQRRHDVDIEVHLGSLPQLLDEFSANPDAVDLFIAGGVDYMQQAHSMGLVEASAPLARAAPVLLVQARNPKEIESFGDLTRPGMWLGIVDGDTNAMGRTIRLLVQHHGLDQEDLESNIALVAETDLELGNAVRLRRIDAAIMWEPASRLFAPCEIVRIAYDDDMALDVAIGLSTKAGAAESAREFMNFMRGRAARALFEQHACATVHVLVTADGLHHAVGQNHRRQNHDEHRRARLCDAFGRVRLIPFGLCRSHHLTIPPVRPEAPPRGPSS